MGKCEVPFCKTLFGWTVFSTQDINMRKSCVFSLRFDAVFIDVCAPCCSVCGVVCAACGGTAMQTEFGLYTAWAHKNMNNVRD